MDRDSVIAIAGVGIGVAALVALGFYAKSFFEQSAAAVKTPRTHLDDSVEEYRRKRGFKKQEEDDDIDSQPQMRTSGGAPRKGAKGKVAKSGEIPFEPPFEAPPGYEWYYNESFFCATIKPEDWVAQDADSKGMFIIYRPQQKSNKTKGRQQTQQPEGLTGLTVSCFPRQKPDWPKNFMDSFSKQLQDEGKEILQDWEEETVHSSFVKYTLMFQETTTEPIRVYNQLIHNKDTGTVYFCIFECKDSEYDDMWEQCGAPLTACMLFHPKL